MCIRGTHTNYKMSIGFRHIYFVFKQYHNILFLSNTILLEFNKLMLKQGMKYIKK